MHTVNDCYHYYLQGQQFTHFDSEEFDFDAQKSELLQNEDFKKALTVHRVTSDINMYKLHR